MSRTKIKQKGTPRLPQSISVIEIQVLDNGTFAMQTKIRAGLDKKTVASVDHILADLKEFLKIGLPVVEDTRSMIIEVVK